MATIQVCAKCGSDAVYFDAWAAVNDPDDVRTFDAVFCDDCGGETSLVDAEDSAEEDD